MAVHAYPPLAIQRAIAAGIQFIEHGHLMDEATAKLMAEKDIWLSTQPFVSGSAALLYRELVAPRRFRKYEDRNPYPGGTCRPVTDLNQADHNA